MPYRDETIRTRKYSLAVLPDVVSSKFASLKPLMVEQQQARQAEIVTFETAVREKLDDYGIIGNFRVMYLNFARAIYRASGHNSGIALKKIVTAEKAKFTQYGLDPAILDEVAACVIGAKAY